MATNIPPSLYTAGAVKFDSSPSVNFYNKLLAQKQAKEDAIAKYVGDLSAKITPTGVRTDDLPAFMDMYNKWKDFGIKNAKAMATNPMLRAQFDADAQRLANFAAESKREEEKKKPIIPSLTDPTKRKLISDTGLKAIQVHDLPLKVQDANGNWIDNPNRKSIDFTEDFFAPKPFDFSKEFGGVSKGMTMGEQLGEQLDRNPVTGKVRIKTTKEFTPTQIGQIASNYVRNIAADPEKNQYYQERFNNLDPKEYEELNSIYQSFYGKKQQVRPDGIILEDHIDSPQKLALAEAIKQARAMRVEGSRDLTDEELRQQRRLELERQKDTLIRGRQKTSGGAITGASGNAFDDFSDNDFGDYKVVNGSWYNKDGTPKTGEIVITGEYIPSTIKSALKSGGIDPDMLTTGVKAKVENGVIKSISNEMIGTITRPAMEGVYQRKMDTEPKYRPQLEFGVKSEKTTQKQTKPQTKTETKTFIFPKGKTKF